MAAQSRARMQLHSQHQREEAQLKEKLGLRRAVLEQKVNIYIYVIQIYIKNMSFRKFFGELLTKNRCLDNSSPWISEECHNFVKNILYILAYSMIMCIGWRRIGRFWRRKAQTTRRAWTSSTDRAKSIWPRNRPTRDIKFVFGAGQSWELHCKRTITIIKYIYACIYLLIFVICIIYPFDFWNVLCQFMNNWLSYYFWLNLLKF